MTGPDVAGAAAVAAGGAVIAGYIYLPTVLVRGLDAIDRWARSGIDALVEDAVQHGVIPPAPAAVLEAPAEEPEPDEFEGARPADIGDCPRCDGTGMYVSYEDNGGRLAGWRVCGWCAGTGMLAPGRGWPA